MSDESSELKKRISQLADEQLIEMVTVSVGDYRQEALDYAMEELKSRGVELPKTQEAEPAKDSDAVPPESETVVDPYSACPVCGGRLRYGTLVAEKELTIVFADNQEER